MKNFLRQVSSQPLGLIPAPPLGCLTRLSTLKCPNKAFNLLSTCFSSRAKAPGNSLGQRNKFHLSLFYKLPRQPSAWSSGSTNQSFLQTLHFTPSLLPSTWDPATAMLAWASATTASSILLCPSSWPFSKQHQDEI